MRRLLYVLLCIFVAAGNCVYAQKDTLHVFNKKAYDRYSVIADSIVRLYYMDAMLPFISKDSARSYYRTLKTPGGGTSSEFDKPLSFEPEMFCFRYYFKHPSFKGDSVEIKFYIHKNGTLMSGFVPEGLFDMRGIERFEAITSYKALEIAQQLKIKRPLNHYEVSLGWYEARISNEEFKKYELSNDLRDFVKGRIVWLVKSEYKIPKEGDETPNIETYLIDVLTGKVLQVWEHAVDWG
ncbi:hypothetical protein [Niabella soli]|uniref:FTP domain-containing protein n=1 Tax=Niabella soli DSM 19437 TaxID=929713 RepID=W0F8Z9_9BACT|nr:hypothetical protein [Niabella soli]AHF17949.1 hypothetical protein NIASO_17455 [Niabella soli DSM 19437]